MQARRLRETMEMEFATAKQKAQAAHEEELQAKDTMAEAAAS